MDPDLHRHAWAHVRTDLPVLAEAAERPLVLGVFPVVHSERLTVTIAFDLDVRANTTG
jgi:hypothetical protein